LPGDYDLCLLKTDLSAKHGWSTGQGWDGMKIKESDVIKYWKRVKE
jgi:hypothetical protein